jgi:K+-sensing histidine kinase KdpD
MGLGLPLVASLVWEIGGQCRLANREDGPGVVVELQLPLSNIPAVGDPSASPSSRRRRSKKVDP